MSATLQQAPASVVNFVPQFQRQASAPVLTLRTQCSNCHLREVCLPKGLSEQDVQGLDDLGMNRRRIKAGSTLFRQGDAFQYFFAVRSGSFKVSIAAEDGREQVTGFHIPGEQVGLDGLAEGKHRSTAIALEDADACAVPYAALSELAMRSANMRDVVGRLMSREIVRDNSLMMLLGNMNASERLGSFLLNLSARLKARGYSASEFHLRMTRAEMGSYLGLKLETVSRMFSEFQREGLLEVDKRHVRILDIEGLKRVCQMQLH